MFILMSVVPQVCAAVKHRVNTASRVVAPLLLLASPRLHKPGEFRSFARRDSKNGSDGKLRNRHRGSGEKRAEDIVRARLAGPQVAPRQCSLTPLKEPLKHSTLNPRTLSQMRRARLDVVKGRLLDGWGLGGLGFRVTGV